MAGQDVQGMLIRIEATTAQLRREMDLADSSVTRATGRIDDQLSRVDSAFDRAGKAASSAANVLKGALALAVGGVGISALVSQAEAYTTVANRLKLVTSNSQEFTAAQNAVFAIAQKSGQPLGATAELYQRIAQNQKELKLTGEGVAGIVETISKTMVISGASTESANAALIQLGQAFASGTLRGEELNSVMEQAPALSQAIAKGMGVSVGALRALGAEGKLTADSVVKALQAQAGAVDVLFGKMQSTIGIALTRIQSSFTKMIGEADNLSGSSRSVADAINQASKAMDAIKVPEAYAILAQYADTLSTILTTVLYAALGKVVGGFAASGGAAYTNIKAMADLAIANQAAAVSAVRKAELDLVSAKNAVELARMNVALAVTVQEVAAAEKALAAAKGQALVMSASLSRARCAEAAANTAAASSATAYGLAMKVATVAATGIARAGAGLLAMLGGPVGLLFIAGAVALSFVDFSSKSKSLMGDLGALGKSVDDVRAEFNKLNEDQQRAQINTWKDKQLGATLAVEQSYKDLKETVQAVMVDVSNTDMVDPGKIAEQVRSYDAVIAKLDAAKSSGAALGPILREAAAAGQISAEQLRTWEAKAALMSDNADVAAKVSERLKAQSDALVQNTSETQANNQAKAGFTAAGEKYLGTLQKQLAGLQDGGNVVKETNRYLAEHTELSEADRTSILSTANAIEANKAATKAATAETKLGNSAAKEAASALKNQAKALDDLLAKSGISTKSANDMADAYLGGADNVRAMTILQKIEEELLKTGAKARDQVTKAVNDLQDAEDRRDVLKAAADLKVEVEQTIAQATATLQGKAALEAFNIQKSISIALVGKNIAIGSEEYKQLLKQTEAQLAANKALESAGRVEGIVDRLSPEIKLLRDYKEAQQDLTDAMKTAPENVALYQDALVKLGYEYEVNRSKATLWGQMTEGAIDRIDEAFASAWGNIGSGAESLWDNLKKGFKQTLGEIAHMLTTKPLLASISNWLTGTDNGQGLSSVWSKLLGTVGGSSSGSSSSGGLGGMVGIGKNLYSIYSAITGVGAQMATGYAAGGLSGAASAGVSYYSTMLSNMVSTMSSGFSSLVSTITGTAATQTAITVGADGITSALLANAVTDGAATLGAQFGTGVATTTAATYAAAESGAAATAASLSGQMASAMSSMAAMWPLAVVMGMYQSGKLYSAGVRPDGGAIRDAAGGTTLGKVALAPSAAMADIWKVTDNVLAKVVGGKWAAILSGSTFAQAMTTKVAETLFGTSYKTKDMGIQLGVDGGQFDAQQYIKQKKKGGWLSGSSKTRYLTSELDSGAKDALGSQYNDTVMGAMALFDKLNVTLNSSVLDGLNMAVTRISTQGKTSEAIQAEIDAWFTTLGDSAVVAINAATGSGFEGFSFEGMATIVNNLYAVNASLEQLGVKTAAYSVAGARQIDFLVAAAGGIDTLNTNMSSYYDSFTSDTQKSADSLEAVRAQFSQLGIVLPETSAAYKEMLKQLDVTSEAGRATFTAMTAMTANAASAASAYAILQQRQSDYYGAFYSESENTARTIAETTAQIKALGVTLPGSRDAFRDMVESAAKDTTASGKAIYDSLMSVAGSAGTVFDALESTAKAAADAAVAAAKAAADALNLGVTNSFSAVQRAITAQQKTATEAYNATNASLTDMASTASKSVSDLTSVSSALDGALKSLRGTSDDAVKILRAQAQATLQSALATARSGGSLSGITGLDDALSTVSTNTTDLYSSLEDFNREQGRTSNVVAELNTLNGKQLTTAEKSLAGLQDQIDQAKSAYDLQMSQYDADLAFAQAQLDALNGIDNSVIGVSAALASLNARVVAALQAQPAGAAQANTPTNNGSIVDTLYQTVLGRGADADGKAYWTDKLQSGALTYQQISQSLANGALAFDSGSYTGPVSQDALAASKAAAQKYLDSLKVPGFASGGFHSGGIRLVGENGPELEVTGPSQIYNANQTASMLNGGSNANLVAEIRALGARLDMIQANTQAGALNGGKTVKLLDRVTDGGNAMLTKDLV